MKNILITGTSKWIWKYLLDDLKEQNNVYWISRTKTNNIWYKEINIDLTNFELFDNFCKKLDQDEIIFDYIILNAGIWEFWKFEDNSFKKYENIINTNLLWNINILKSLENNINNNTKIIFIWSIISKKFMKNAAVYQASKFWLRGFAWGLKSEWKKVFILNPKIVETWFHDGKIKLDKRFTETKLIDILSAVKNILNWDETRFEIDL